MRKKMLLLVLPLLALTAGATGMLTPREAHAGGICNYFCLDPQLTCCITCYWMGSQCVCPEFCSIGPNDG